MVRGATPERRQQVIRTVEQALAPFGRIAIRSWGDVVSIELITGGKVVFSFQIARRSAQMEPTEMAPWIAVQLDSFADLVASKMVAIVERGAPHDFRDIFTLCRAGLTTPCECWELWRRHQELAGSDTDGHRARLAVETHLARIAQHRPLEGITNPQERAQAEESRVWFKEDFLNALET